MIEIPAETPTVTIPHLSVRADAAVVVGRFQVDQLHVGHRALIQAVSGGEYRRTAVVLGVAPMPGPDNPLDFHTRARMIQEAFPNVVVLPLADRETDEEWSSDLDRLVRTTFPVGAVDLYGGRDSFVRLYKGRFRALELEDPTRSGDGPSGSAVRDQLRVEVRPTRDFRAGAIYQETNRYSRVYPTVDVIITRLRIKNSQNESWTDNGPFEPEVLLVRKPDEKGWRMPGGFVDPKDGSPKRAALRELQEETGLRGHEIEFVDSAMVPDWRVPKGDAIMTMVFTGTVKGDVEPIPADDIQEARFFSIEEAKRVVGDTHRRILLANLPEELCRSS